MPKSLLRLLSAILCAAMLVPAGCGKSAADNSFTSFTTEPDPLPPATDRLVIYISETMSMAVNKVLFDRALDTFKKKFPLVEVEVIEDRYRTDSLINMCLEKNGPDLLFDYEFYEDDYLEIIRLYDSDIFYNLDLLFGADAEFRPDDYIPGLFHAGRKDGALRYVPVGAMMYCFVGPKEILEQNGLDIWNTDFFGFADKLARYCAAIAQDRNRWLTDEYGQSFTQRWALPYSGLEYIDYDAKTFDVDTEEFHALMKLCKAAYPVADGRGEKYPFEPNENLIGTRKQEFYGNLTLALPADSYRLHNVVAQYREILSFGYTPVIYVIPAADGGKPRAYGMYPAAVSANGKNIRNAYEFIKILLSPEIQGSIVAGSGTVLLREIEDRLRTPFPLYPSEVPPDIALQEEDIQLYMDMISTARFSAINSVAHRMFYYADHTVYDAMLPYFKGEAGYDECLAELKIRLERYLK